jgi:hypothetical protein
MSANRSYEDRMNSEIASYRDVENVHALPEIFHYWSAAILHQDLAHLA